MWGVNDGGRINRRATCQVLAEDVAAPCARVGRAKGDALFSGNALVVAAGLQRDCAKQSGEVLFVVFVRGD